MSELILALMIALIPPSYQKDDNAHERYQSIAAEIAWRADTPTLAFFLLTVARHESSFRLDIHNGDTLGDQGRSWGLFQILCGRNRNAKVPGTDYRAHEIIGTSSMATARAVDAAAIWLKPFIKSCGGRPMCVFKRYGGIGKHTDKKTLKRLRARVATYWRLRAIAKGMGKSVGQ